MTDLEMTKACAEAMGYEDSSKGYRITQESNNISVSYHPPGVGIHNRFDYWPLTDDAQAMALVKRFGLVCDPQHDGQDFAADPGWEVSHPSMPNYISIHPDLNRAVCECVAKLHTETKANI